MEHLPCMRPGKALCRRFVGLFGLCHAFDISGFVCGMLGDNDLWRSCCVLIWL